MYIYTFFNLAVEYYKSIFPKRNAHVFICVSPPSPPGRKCPQEQQARDI